MFFFRASTFSALAALYANHVAARDRVHISQVRVDEFENGYRKIVEEDFSIPSDFEEGDPILVHQKKSVRMPRPILKKSVKTKGPVSVNPKVVVRSVKRQLPLSENLNQAFCTNLCNKNVGCRQSLCVKTIDDETEICLGLHWVSKARYLPCHEAEGTWCHNRVPVKCSTKDILNGSKATIRPAKLPFIPLKGITHTLSVLDQHPAEDIVSLIVRLAMELGNRIEAHRKPGTLNQSHCQTRCEETFGCTESICARSDVSGRLQCSNLKWLNDQEEDAEWYNRKACSLEADPHCKNEDEPVFCDTYEIMNREV